jgi:F0F1-type ATP synthase membrane subunit c/vacuolar-type H+-ATPase subunit K
LVPDLARTPAIFKNHFLHLVFGEAIMIFFFTVIFAHGFAAGGVDTGQDDTSNECFEP